MGNDLNLIATEIVAALNRGDFGWSDLPNRTAVPGYTHQALIDKFNQCRENMELEFESSLRKDQLNGWTESDIKHYSSTSEIPSKEKLLAWVGWQDDVSDFYISVPIEANGKTLGYALIFEEDPIEPTYCLTNVFESAVELDSYIEKLFVV